jgi:hypothetical protein
LLFWASLRAGELIADGDLDAREAARALTGAATQIGLADEDGQSAVAASIRSGFQRAGATYQPPDHPARDHRQDQDTCPARKPLIRCSARPRRRSSVVLIGRRDDLASLARRRRRRTLDAFTLSSDTASRRVGDTSFETPGAAR